MKCFITPDGVGEVSAEFLGLIVDEHGDILAVVRSDGLMLTMIHPSKVRLVDSTANPLRERVLAEVRDNYFDLAIAERLGADVVAVRDILEDAERLGIVKRTHGWRWIGGGR